VVRVSFEARTTFPRFLLHVLLPFDPEERAMAVQANNLILLELDATTGIGGMPRTLSSSDDIELDVADMTWNASGTVSLATGGSTLDLQGPDINLGTLDSGDSANATIDIGQPASIITVDGAALYVDAPTYFRAAEIGLRMEAGESLASGDVVTIDGSQNPASPMVPRMVKAEADAGDQEERAFAGVVTSASLSANALGYIAAVAGSVVPVTFKADDLPVQGEVGAPVYVSTDAGKAQMTAPSTSGQTVYQIGLLVSETAVVGAKYAVQLQPQLIGRIP
jgi:hypothetical protein